jgi:hypothetical protein
MKTLTKIVLELKWVYFFLIFLGCLGGIALLFSAAVYYCESPKFSWTESLLYSVAATIGAPHQAPSLGGLGLTVIIVARLCGHIWLAVFIAFLIARIGDTRRKPRLAKFCAAYYDDGSKHCGAREARYLFEFRLIVYPTPPVYKPVISVALYVQTQDGREQYPLDLTPVQPNRVTAYLTFRAILPAHFLTFAEMAEVSILRKLPEGCLDVCVDMTDSASDKRIIVHKSYIVPHDVRAGHFLDAIEYGDGLEIFSVNEKNLEKIERF